MSGRHDVGCCAACGLNARLGHDQLCSDCRSLLPQPTPAPAEALSRADLLQLSDRLEAAADLDIIQRGFPGYVPPEATLMHRASAAIESTLARAEAAEAERDRLLAGLEAAERSLLSYKTQLDSEGMDDCPPVVHAALDLVRAAFRAARASAKEASHE